MLGTRIPIAVVVDVSLCFAALTIVIIHEILVLNLKALQLLTLLRALPFSLTLDLC
jgi:hypothetical protein